MSRLGFSFLALCLAAPAFGSVTSLVPCAERILVVNSWSSARFFARELERRGIEVHGILGVKELPELGKATFEVGPGRTIIPFLSDMASLIEAARVLRPQAVLLGGDSDGGWIVDNIAHALSLPGNNKDTWKWRRVKSATQDRFAEMGRPHIRHIVTAHIDDAIAFAARVTYPVYLKPDSDGGGVMQFEVQDEAELRRDFAQMLASADNKSLLNPVKEIHVSEFVSGTEVATQGVVTPQGTKITSVLEYDKVLIPGHGRVYRSEWILPPEHPLAKEAIEFVLDGNQVVDYRWGVFHWEIMKRKNGPMVPMELNARFSGSSLVEFFKDALGYSEVEVMADAVEDVVRGTHLYESRPPVYCLPANGYGFRYFPHTPRDGMRLNPAVLEKIKQIPGFIRIRELAPGPVLRKTTDMRTIPVSLEFAFDSEATRIRVREELLALQAAEAFFLP